MANCPSCGVYVGCVCSTPKQSGYCASCYNKMEQAKIDLIKLGTNDNIQSSGGYIKPEKDRELNL